MKAGWRVSPLGEVADHSLGKMLDKNKNKGTPKPYLRNLNVRWFGFDLSDVLEMKFEDGEADRYSLRRGDVAVCEGGYPGRAAIWENDEPIFIQKAIHRVRFHEPERARWFVYYLSFCDVAGTLKNHFTGSGIQHFTGQALAKFPIPLPPLEEQRRIVAILDEAFEGLDRARVNAEANLASARELFDSYASSAFGSQRDRGIDDRFMTTVGAVCDIQSGAGFPTKYQGELVGKYPFYKVSDMNLPGNEWSLVSANNYISEATRRLLRARLFPRGSIVFPKVGGAIATNKKRIVEAEGCVDNNVMGLIPDQSKVLPEYVHEWLRAFDVYEFSNKANPPSITQGTVANWPLRVPSPAEQERVVAIANELRQETEKLAERFRARAADIVDLRQSLLQRAFAGELT